jgi:hypothetical protein
VIPSIKQFIEVKAGKTNPLEFQWFLKSFKKEELIVISQSRFETDRIKGITLEDFLLS